MMSKLIDPIINNSFNVMDQCVKFFLNQAFAITVFQFLKVCNVGIRVTTCFFMIMLKKLMDVCKFFISLSKFVRVCLK